MNLIEKIADDFVQEILKDLPLEIFLIETDMSDFIDDKKISADQLNEHLKQHLDSK
jgi:Tat protein secretion system quality control protein TatD with DNase activity